MAAKSTGIDMEQKLHHCHPVYFRVSVKILNSIETAELTELVFLPQTLSPTYNLYTCVIKIQLPPK